MSNPVSLLQSQTQTHQTQAQQQQQPHHINTQTLLAYSGFLSNTTRQTTTIIQAPQTELVNCSNTAQLSTQPIKFANTDKTHSSELPQPFHTVSNITDTPQNASLISDTSISDPLSSQFSSPTPSQIAGNFFNPPQGPTLILNAYSHKPIGITLLIESIHHRLLKINYRSVSKVLHL